jgi:RND superfamily putative drug exporter
MLVRLADWCYRRRRLVVVLWIAALLGSFALSAAFGGEFKQNYLQPGSESKAASDALTERFPERAGDTVQVVVHADDGLDTPALKSRAEQIFADVARSPHVVGVVSPFSEAGAGQISPDGTTAYAEVALDKKDNEFTVTEAKALVDPVVAAGDDILQVEVGGAVAKLSQAAPVGSEVIGLLAAAVILLFTFGSAVAMGLPLLTALFGLGIATGVGGLIMRVVDVPDWAPPVAAMVGIGVGIDYALLIVTRFRGGLAEGQDPRRATLTAVATAGRAVIFAGLTVVVSLLGILFMAQPSMTGFAFAVIPAVLIVMAASVTLLPALLGFAGRNIERWHVPFVSKDVRAYDASRWYRWSRFIQHRPLVAAVGSVVVLLALAAPFLGIRFGFPDAKNDPPSYTTRQAYDLLADGFGPGFSSPLLVTVQGSEGDALLSGAETLRAELADVAGVAAVEEPVANPAGDTVLLQVVPTTSPQDEATGTLVDTLRDDAVPGAVSGTALIVHVGGPVAANLDTTRGTFERLPYFFGGVLLMSFLLLMLVFRSVVVPVKAVVMNLLATSVALGVLAYAVSGSPLGELVGIPEETPIPIQLPIGIFAILFGLSMDYEIFLLSRIKEEYDRTGDNALAVADGLAKSARVITAGAAVMVTVFGSFVLGSDTLGKMFGIGLATAILVDATIIRMVLVPATMELLGDRNWWLPGWLDRLLPDVHVEGHELTDVEYDARGSIGRQRAPADELAPTGSPTP